jgi:hypothetical protein
VYGWLLFLHSWVRWALLLVGVVSLAMTLRTDREWSKRDERLSIALVGLADLQLLLGLCLWIFASPLTHLAFSERLLFKGAPFTFFALFHPIVMLGALFFLHVQRLLQKKRGPSVKRWRETLLIWLVVVVLAIPWPCWPFGRELFRGVP